MALLATLMVACTTPTVPTSPTRLWTDLTDSGLDVSWSPVDGATDYELQYTDLDDPGPGTPVSLPVSGTTASLSGLPDGHEFKLKVRAILSGSAAGWSATLYSTFVVPVLPTIRIDTVGREPVVSKDDYLDGTFELDALDGSAPITDVTEIKGRGNTTWAALKKPYRVKLDSKQPILGIAESRHWVLLADYFDPTHLRNQTAFELGHETGLGWTPHSRQVELILNGAYQGVYQITEHVRLAGDRIDIDELDEDDNSGDAITGGYLAEVDNYPPGPGDVAFHTPRNQLINIKDPEPPTAQQFSYLSNYVTAFENTLYSPGFADPAAGYAAYLDVESMVDYYLVQELIRNQDAFLGSTYFYKPRLGRLTMGPLWDFDNSMGNDRGWDTGEPTGWFVRRPDLKWIGRLFDDPAFAAAVADRWDQLKPEFDQMPGRIIANGAAIATPMQHEHHLWNYKPSPIDTPTELADWLQTRIDWIDANIHSAP